MKNFFIGVDTETSNSLISNENKLDLTQSLVYDVGWSVIDETGRPYLKRSYVVAEIFLDKELMDTAYFKEKIPQYWKDIKSGKRELKTFKNIWYQFLKDAKKYHVKNVFAHNAIFDWRSLNNTIRYLTGSKNRYFFPYRIEMWDTLKMSRDVLGKNKKYSEFCRKNNYMTKHSTPQNRLTAEIIYRFISGDNDFEESHTGLEDVEIEVEIFKYCIGKKKNCRKMLWENQSIFVFCQTFGPGALNTSNHTPQKFFFEFFKKSVDNASDLWYHNTCQGERKAEELPRVHTP